MPFIVSPSYQSINELISEPQGFPAPGLLKTPHPVRLTSTTACVNMTVTSAWLVHSYLWRPIGTLGVVARTRLTDICNPHSSVFKDEHPRVALLPDSRQGFRPAFTGEPLGITPSRPASG
jgi:hypothetical protein